MSRQLWAPPTFPPTRVAEPTLHHAAGFGTHTSVSLCRLVGTAAAVSCAGHRARGLDLASGCPACGARACRPARTCCAALLCSFDNVPQSLGLKVLGTCPVCDGTGDGSQAHLILCAMRAALGRQGVNGRVPDRIDEAYLTAAATRDKRRRNVATTRPGRSGVLLCGQVVRGVLFLTALAQTAAATFGVRGVHGSPAAGVCAPLHGVRYPFRMFVNLLSRRRCVRRVLRRRWRGLT